MHYEKERGVITRLLDYLGVAIMVERPLWEREAVGSNPTTLTKTVSVPGSKRVGVRDTTDILGL